MAVFPVLWRGFYHTAPQIGSPLRVAESVRGMDRPETDGVVDEIHRYPPLARTAAPRRRGDGRSSLRLATGERPAAIQHSALSIQHSALPPPPRDHLPTVRVAPEQLDDAGQSPPASVPAVIHTP